MQEIAALFSESTWLLDSLARHRRFKRSADTYEWYDKANYTVLAHDKDMVENGEYGFFYMYCCTQADHVTDISELDLLPKVSENIWFRGNHSTSDLVDEMKLLFI